MDSKIYNQITALNQDLQDIRQALDFFLQYSASANNIGYSQVADYIERVEPTGYDFGIDFEDINYSSASRAEALDWYESSSLRLDLSVEYKNYWNPAWTSSVDHKPPREMIYFPVIDTSNLVDMSGMFEFSSVYVIPILDTSKVQSIYRTFAGSDIYTLPLLDFSNVTNTTQAFSYAMRLHDIGGFEGLKVSLDLHNCTGITHQSLINIINYLGIPNTTATLTLYSGVYNLLTAEEIALAESKNWSIVT